VVKVILHIAASPLHMDGSVVFAGGPNVHPASSSLVPANQHPHCTRAAPAESLRVCQPHRDWFRYFCRFHSRDRETESPTDRPRYSCSNSECCDVAKSKT